MNWYPLWSYHFQNYESLPAVTAGISQIMKIPFVVNARKIRLLFSNENGKRPVVFRNGILQNGNMKATITWSGKTELQLQPGQECMTDELDVVINQGDTIIIRITPEGTFTGYVGLNSNTFFRVEFQDEVGSIINPSNFSDVVKKPFNTYVYFGIKSIEIDTEHKPKVVTVFGDSLVHQGHWFQALYKQYYMKKRPVVFLNEGISGNRLLREANTISSINSVFGKSGIQRIEADVYGRYRPDIVILAEGINDLVHPGNGCPKEELPTSEELISGILQLCEIIKGHGSKPFVATISPFYGYGQSWSEEKEYIRQNVNQWIRKQKVEKIIDIDGYVKSEKNSACLDKKFDSGDHLHLNHIAGEWIVNQLAREIDFGKVERYNE